MESVLPARTEPSVLDLAAAVRDHYEAVYRFCAYRIGEDAAADAAQETFLTAQRAAARFRFASSVRTWLFGIALNECRRWSRRYRDQPPVLQFEPAGDDPSTEWIDRNVLGQAIAQLSEDHREVVLLHEIDGLTYVEIAQVLDIPEGTVKSRLHHAFLKLRSCLKESNDAG